MSLQIKTKKTLKEKGKVLRNAKLHDMVITFFNVPVFFVCTWVEHMDCTCQWI